MDTPPGKVDSKASEARAHQALRADTVNSPERIPE